MAFNNILRISALALISTTIAFNSFAYRYTAVEATAKNTKKGLSDQQIKSVVTKALNTFNTPGMSVGVVYQGNVIHLAGYGIKNIESQQFVDENTLFRLASTSKAFTVASLAILVDEKKLNWQDKVIDYLPEFKMKDHWVTGEFTIADLLTHKSGLVSSAGDAMLWPEPTGFTRKEIIHNLRYLTPEYSFRSKYAYSNLMYITAGEIVAKITKQPWETFVEQRIFKPLNMDCYAGDMPEFALNNVAMSHGDNNGELYTIPRNGIHGSATVSAAAGGIVCNASSMVNWLQMLLDEGKNSANELIFSEQRLNEMWTSQTILPQSKYEKARNHSHFRTYGYGWRKNDYLGYEMISHTGTLSGMQAYVALIPEMELGVVLLNNGSNSGARSAVMQTILRGFITDEKSDKNHEKIDWVEDYRLERLERSKKYWAKHKTPKGSGKVLLSANAYTGQFQDHWYGTADIRQTEQGLRLNFPKMVQLNGTLEAFNDHSFVVRWDNKNAADDAFIHFQVGVDGEVKSFTMRPFKLEESISHEYRDMVFIRQNQN